MTSNVSLDARYFDWLYGQIAPKRNKNPARSYWQLCEAIFRMEFLWSIANDDNRIEDGVDLRMEFLAEAAVEGDRDFLTIGCSVLEMLVALCRRAAFESTHDVYWWFRRILENLTIGIYTDDQFDDGVKAIVQEIWTDVINRQYRPDGVGGLFPLRHPEQDQRTVELWNQMSAYIIENNEF